MKPKPIVIGLALASLFFAILLPPEAYSDGKLVVLLCATFAFFISVTENRVDHRYLKMGLAVFAILIAHTMLFSVDTYRSFELIATLWTYYCLGGFFLYAGFDPIMPLSISMVGLSIIVSTYGLYQYLWGFDQLAALISNSGNDATITAPLLGRVDSHRVFSTLALPGTLWGFLVMAIPFHAAVWDRSRQYGKQKFLVSVVLSISMGLLLITGLLTRSFGFLAGLLVMALVWLVIHHQRRLWNRITVVLMLLSGAGALTYVVRRGVIEAANPVILRFANWISAWSIFSMHPLGTGLNTFGLMYPRYMLSGANETQFAHNTILQLLSELGYVAIAAGVVLLLLAVKYWPRAAKLRIAERECVVIAVAVWCLHNFIDIDFYFGSVGTVGAILIGVLFRNSEATVMPPGKPLMAGVGIFATAAVAFSGLVMFSTELQNRAKGEYESLKPQVAIETLIQARRFMPLNSSLYLDMGQIQLELSQIRHDPQYLSAARESFRRSIELSPNKVDSHIGLGLCLSASHDVAAGLKEIRVAQKLYPDNTYARTIVHLMEKSLNATP
jgi:tetratricopeptide (TPR) repeat protein